MAVNLSTDQDFKELVASNDKVVVKYFADWCGQCKLFSPKFKRLSNDPRFEGVVFLDIDAEKNPEARAMASVDSLPYFATFHKGALSEGSATSKEDKVVAMLEKIL